MAKAKRHFNPWNFFICWLISLGQIAFGYPASIIGVTLAQPSFLVYMGLLDPKTAELTPGADQLIGATSGVFQVSYLHALPQTSTDTDDRQAHSSMSSLLDGLLISGAVRLDFIGVHFSQ